MNYAVIGLVLMCLCGCSSTTPSAQRTLLGISGYGMSLELLSTSATAPPVGGESEVTVGKWASYAKRGSAAQTGFVKAPVDADWSVGTLTATTIPMNLLSPIPEQAGRWGYLVVNNATGVAVAQNVGLATPLTATGLVSGTTYRVQIAWFQTGSLARVSDWSPPRTVTLP